MTGLLQFGYEPTLSMPNFLIPWSLYSEAPVTSQVPNDHVPRLGQEFQSLSLDSMKDGICSLDSLIAVNLAGQKSSSADGQRI